MAGRPAAVEYRSRLCIGASLGCMGASNVAVPLDCRVLVTGVPDVGQAAGGLSPAELGLEDRPPRCVT
ncbi:MAG: hypothetical protein ACKOD9_10705 [Rubrivivax sp.]